MVQSSKTARIIQVRNQGFLDGRVLTSTTGIVIRDEGDNDQIPLIQFAFPNHKTEQANVFVPLPDLKCKVQGFIDGKAFDINHEAPHDAVNITRTDKEISVVFKKSQFKVMLTLGYWNGCIFNVCVHWPTTDPVKGGLLGSPDNNPANDWASMDGSVVETIPDDRMERKGKAGYDFCNKHYCIADENDSLFTYNELGLDHSDFYRCKVPFGTTDETLLKNVTDQMRHYCHDGTF